jgi:D-amino-acid dehydrogenase
MGARKIDVVVLGAGMVGVAAALHVQARGRSVALIDRHPHPAGETSFGNAGLIEVTTVKPTMFPRDPGALLRYAFNAAPEANYHLTALPRLAPFLYAFFRASGSAGLARSSRSIQPLSKVAAAEQNALIAQAGAESLVRRTGWLKLYRDARNWADARDYAEACRVHGYTVDEMDAAAVAALEPNLTPERLHGALMYRDVISVRDPGDLVAAYCDLFLQRGGRFETGDARTLTQDGEGWSVTTAQGPLQARDVVLALGPWSNDLFEGLGYRMPFGVKRGYHLHFSLKDGARLEHPVYDATGGFLLAPMRRGVRLTTGVEFADRDAPPTPAQIARTRPIAEKLLPLGEPIDAQPWMGRRPCMADMLPVVGPAPRHKGLWFDFGHQHLGLTLGPATGRLVAEMMTGEQPFLDPTPYRADRFN